MADHHPNPVIAAIDAGHVQQPADRPPPPKGKRVFLPDEVPAGHCKADGEPWKCTRIRAAEIAAKERADRMIAERDAQLRIDRLAATSYGR